ncbi:S8 family serine peptidase [Dyella acidiphila]|uniref:Autotransporter domain-containing protein n=1 Tax=Dyella acidiphila TaxID=2775866 RepID=A0ABR9G7Z5_9GAMM|nr:S8 family serine peptidase [Dyella acidiphila]MBE1160172.1 autotransporter domain-containing protein [Dyella acidiphila]
MSQLSPENVQNAWAVGGTLTGNQGQGVKVGIIDSGVDASNPALLNRITWFKDYTNSSNTTPQDAYGHGTVMAEIIGGVAVSDGNPLDFYVGGVAPQASLYVAKLGDSTSLINTTLAPQALIDLANQGVQLINNSYGSAVQITSVTATSPQVTQDYSLYQWSLKSSLNGELMVWAAGNDGHPQPSVEAGLPYYEPSLKNNWLTVVNVSLNASGQVTGLDADATSNACGVAAPWCLAAAGYTYFSPVSNTAFSTGAADGTSGAAAVVTGIAALVWQRFPFFTPSNVQQTLLGTATNLGSPAFYGYGLVNAQAAVNGPGQLNWGVFDVNMPAGSSAIFANNMTGTGSIQLDGDGTLALAGRSNIGGIVINGGVLDVGGYLDQGTYLASGSVTLPSAAIVNNGEINVIGALNADVTLGSGGALDGVPYSVLNGNVTSSGWVKTAGGGVYINGNYTALAGTAATTEIQMGYPLMVAGVATLNSTALQIDFPAGYIAAGQQVLMLQANGGVIGEFGPVGVSNGIYINGSLSYTATQVEMTVTQASVSSIAQTSMSPLATTQQTAQHIQSALTQANLWAATNPAAHQTFLDSAMDFLRVSSIPLAEASINSLSGQELASSQGLTFEQAGIINRNVADRLVDIEQGNTQQGAWFQGTGADGSIARSGYATGNYSGGGSLAGYDVKLADDFMLGVGLDWNHLSANYTLQAGTNTSRSTGAMLYAKWTTGNAYVSGRIGEDWIHSDTSRWGVLGVVPAAITSSRNDTMTSAYLEGGYNFRSDAWTTTPFVSAGDEHLDRAAINEQGAGGFGIAAPGEDFNQSYAQVGARLAYRWNWGAGELSLKGYALYQRILGGRDLGFTAAYAGAPAATFQLEGVNTARNSEWVGAGVNAMMNQHWSWYVDLDGQFASGGTRARTISAGARYRF